MSKQIPGVCPNCRADHNISYGFAIQLDSSNTEQYYETECHNCGTTWEEHYTLVFDSQEQIEKPSDK